MFCKPASSFLLFSSIAALYLQAVAVKCIEISEAYDYTSIFPGVA